MADRAIRDFSEFQTNFERIASNVEKVIQGKGDIVRLSLVALISEGHVLLEDVPGVGKTMLAKSLARSLGCTWSRIQFTPDLLPTDVTGVSVWDRNSGAVRFQARSRIRQHLPGRRDQQGLAENSVGPPRMHGGASGHHRREHSPSRSSLHGHGDTEPDRAGGHLSLYPNRNSIDSRCGSRWAIRAERRSSRSSTTTARAHRSTRSSRSVPRIRSNVSSRWRAPVHVAPSLKRYVVDLDRGHPRVTPTSTSAPARGPLSTC